MADDTQAQAAPAAAPDVGMQPSPMAAPANQPGFLQSFGNALGQGMQNAGAILSPMVYKTQAIERQNQLTNVMRSFQIANMKREYDADSKFDSMMQGKISPGMTSTAMLDAVKGVDPAILSASKNAQAYFGMIQHTKAQEDSRDAKMYQIAATREATAGRLSNQFQANEDRRMHYEDIARQAGINERDRDEARKQALQLQAQNAGINQELRRMGLNIQQQNADTRREQVSGKISDTEQKTVIGPADEMIGLANEAKAILDKQGDSVTGIRGKVGRGAEFLGIASDEDATRFKQIITQLQSTYRRSKLGGGSSRLKADANQADDIIPGLSSFTNSAQSRAGLDQFISNTQKKANSLLGRSHFSATSPAEQSGPKPGEQRVINGQNAEWDGKGWKAVPATGGVP